MRNLKRNSRPFWYATYKGEEDLLDGEGRPTGERITRYNTPVQIRGNINSSFNGRYGINSQSAIEDFGRDLRYDKTLIVDAPDCPIDEHTVLIIDKPLEFDDQGEPIYNHVVIKVDKSLNVCSYSLRMVNVS